MAINLVDIGLMAVFVIIACLGFLGGTIRLLLVLISLYLGAVVAALFYLPIASFLFRSFDAIDSFSAQLLAFFLLLILATAALTFTLIRTFTIRQLPRFLAGLDQIGGGALGVIAATFSAVLISVMLRLFFDFMVQMSDAGTPMWPAVLGLAAQTRGSSVVHLFLSLSQPIFMLLRPWFPGGLPSILGLG